MVKSALGEENVYIHNQFIHDLLDLPFCIEADGFTDGKLDSMDGLSSDQKVRLASTRIVSDLLSDAKPGLEFVSVWDQWMHQSKTFPLDLPSNILIRQDEERGRLYNILNSGNNQGQSLWQSLYSHNGSRIFGTSSSSTNAGNIMHKSGQNFDSAFSIIPGSEEIRNRLILRMQQYCTTLVAPGSIEALSDSHSEMPGISKLLKSLDPSSIAMMISIDDNVPKLIEAALEKHIKQFLAQVAQPIKNKRSVEPDTSILASIAHSNFCIDSEDLTLLWVD
jgi:hypothetical protein